MKKIYCLSIIFISTFSFGQGENNIWLLGYSTGTDQYTSSQKATIDFINGTPSIIPNVRKMKFSGTQGNISDKNGNLLMSSNGIWIANANGDTMLNGSDLNPGLFADNHPYGSTIPNGNIFLPFPGDSNKYALIHQIGNYQLNLACGELFYSIIDMSLDSGLGGVMIKNQIALQDTFCWGLGACKHANGRDWWIVTIKENSNKLYLTLLTPNGITNVSSQTFPSLISDLGNVSQPVFSNDGNKFAFTTSHWVGGSSPWNLQLNYFDFDRCTGNLSNYTALDLSDGNMGVGTAFSKNSEFLYVATTQHVFQINTISPIMTFDTVATYDGFLSATSPTIFGLLYLAEDNKIYITSGNYGVDLHIINNPDSAGIACDVQQHVLHVPCYHDWTVPAHPNSFLGSEPGSLCDSLTTGISKNLHDFNLSIAPNPSNGNFSLNYLLPQNKTGVFEIYDMDGRKVYSQILSQWSTIGLITLLNLTTGFYQCVIKSENFWSSKKLVIVE